MVAPVVTAGLISAGASLVGGLFGDNSAKKAAARAARENREQLQNQHQWEVKDLRKAGLNPILSGTGGGGSGTISTPVAETGNTGRGLARAGEQLLQAKLIEAQTENLDSVTRKNNQEYQFDRYFRPLERMQGLTSGRQGIAASKAATDNTLQGLQNLKADLVAKNISNQDAARLLARKINEPEFRDWIDSAPYADRQAVKDLLSGNASGSALAKGLDILIRILGGK